MQAASLAVASKELKELGIFFPLPKMNENADDFPPAGPHHSSRCEADREGGLTCIPRRGLHLCSAYAAFLVFFLPVNISCAAVPSISR